MYVDSPNKLTYIHDIHDLYIHDIYDILHAYPAAESRDDHVIRWRVVATSLLIYNTIILVLSRDTQKLFNHVFASKEPYLGMSLMDMDLTFSVIKRAKNEYYLARLTTPALEHPVP